MTSRVRRGHSPAGDTERYDGSSSPPESDVRRATRGLRRQLESAGTSYGAVLDRLRRSRSLELIDDPTRSIESIATELGYSDAANFTRAFRRWTGFSPTEHRRR